MYSHLVTSSHNIYSYLYYTKMLRAHLHHLKSNSRWEKKRTFDCTSHWEVLIQLKPNRLLVNKTEPNKINQNLRIHLIKLSIYELLMTSKTSVLLLQMLLFLRIFPKYPRSVLQQNRNIEPGSPASISFWISHASWKIPFLGWFSSLMRTKILPTLDRNVHSCNLWFMRFDHSNTFHSRPSFQSEKQASQSKLYKIWAISSMNLAIISSCSVCKLTNVLTSAVLRFRGEAKWAYGAISSTISKLMTPLAPR